MKSKLMPTIVLSAICLVVALLLSVVNLVTAPIIEERQQAEANKALAEVLPGATEFEEIDISTFTTLPATVDKAYSSPDGCVIQLTVSGYKPGLVIMVGIGNDAKIAGVKHIASNETFGFEGQLNGAYVGKDSGTLSKIIATGATANSLTSNAYYTAMKDALAAYAIFTADGGN